MDCRAQDKIVAFDTLFSNNHIQMLKILLPFMDNQAKSFLAGYIKFLELSYTVNFCKNHSLSLCGLANISSSCNCGESCGCDNSASNNSPDLSSLCGELIPFCNDREKQQMEQIRNVFQSMETYREMLRTMEMMKEFMPDMGMGDLFQHMQAASFSDGNSFGADFFKDNSAENTSASDSNENASGFNMTNILMNMMTPEQKEMFHLFGGNEHAK